MRKKLLLAAVAAGTLVGCDSGGVQLETPLTPTAITTETLEPELGAATGGNSVVGSWGPVFDWPHVAVSMASLPDGRILTYSGSERRTWPTTEQTYSATWNPDNGEFHENLHLGHNMFCAAMSMTSDGQLLVNGGRNQGNSPWTTLFDYRDNHWHTVQNMASGGRWYPTTLAMGDGKVMTAMGSSTNTRNPDLWDPDAGWRVLNGVDFINMRQRNNEFGRDNSWPLLSVAPNGNVYHYWDTIENQMISPLGNGNTRVVNPTTDGINHAGGVQTMYDAGKLLISGRNDGSWGGNATGAAENAFTIDLNGATPNIRATANMRHKRKYHQLIPLPNGEVLVIGGNTTGAKFRDSGSVMEPEIWNPQNGTWRGMANMAVPRDYHSTALLLTDGRILTAGGGYSGGDANSAGTHQDAQVFSPPYLYADNGSLASRPTVAAAQPSADTGESIAVTTTGDVSYFSLIRMSATTHSMNTDARFYKPEFESTGGNQYSVTVHENPNIAIPGYWMLFAVNSAGVPSEAQVVRVNALDTRFDNLALGGTATQSSTLPSTLDFEPSNAIDGNLSGDDDGGSLTHTQNELQSWWELDLGRIVEIDTIRLWNRTDCCADRLSDFHVLVSPRSFASKDLDTSISQNGVLDFHTPGVAGRQTDISVLTQGRYVRVQLTKQQALQLAEVQVFGSQRTDLVNVAVDGTASQSSTYLNSPAMSADNAIDGVTGGGTDASNPSVGGGGGGAFDLSCNAGEVLAGIWGSSGTYINSVGPRCVAVDSTGSWLGQPLDRQRSGPAGGTAYSRTCASDQAVTGFNARSDIYVNQIGLRCQTLTSDTSMSGSITNLQNAGPATGTQRGPLSCNGSVSTGIVGRSGNWMDAFGLQCARNGEFNHTNNDVNSWLELDIGRVVDIDTVVVWNRTDCCTTRLSDFHVFVSDTPFTSKGLSTTLTQAGVLNRYNQGAAASRTEVAIGRSGRYIRVQLNGTNYLHMAELQVMTAPLAIPLSVDTLVANPLQQDTDLTLTAAATGSGSLQYQWNFGDGSADTAFSTDPSTSHRYSEPGRYVVSVTVRDGNGDEVRQTFTQIVHQALTTNKPVASTSVIEHSVGPQLWNVNPDNNSVSVINTSTLALLAEIDVGRNPVSLAEAPNGDVWVINRESADISVISSSTLAVTATFPLQRASQPYGIVFGSANAFVALEAVGKVQEINSSGAIAATRDVGASPRHLSLDASAEKLYVSRFITPKLPGEDTATPIVDDGTRQYGGEVLVMDTATLGVSDTIILQHSNLLASENQGPGIPNYLGPAVISPAGDVAWLPSKQDNIFGGALRGGIGITFDQTVRAITSKIDLATSTESLTDRVDHDNASVATQSVFDPYGVTVFSSLEGNRQISIIDTSTAIEIGRFDTGRAPQGLAMSRDGQRLYVHNFMDRTIGVYDIADIVSNGSTDSSEIATINVVSNEILEATVLRGKQLFYDARDDRLASLDYMSCASCHVDGEHDGRVWDFTSLGEGLRNTITLKGRAGMGQGILHWTGNFDEVQDFEGQIRDFAGGSGLMTDADFSGTADPLGNPKAGFSSDLDALASYLTSLDRVDDSPWRNADGTQTADALTGEGVFVAKGCTSCHSGIEFTDSIGALRHDVGSLMPESGLRLGAALDGLDTPSVLGVWRTAPYLHDGSGDTLQDAVAAHLSISTTAAEQDQLAAYLSQLDSGTSLPPVLPPPPPPAPANGTVSNPLANNAITLDGAINEWTSVDSFGIDGDDGNDPIDWLEAWIANDDNNFYIAYQNDTAIDLSWGFGIYIDVDGDLTTGFSGFGSELPIGADYLLEGRDLLRYTGTGNNWDWQPVGEVSLQTSGANAEISLPRSLLGNPTTMRLFFHGDNSANGGTVLDHYPADVLNAAASNQDRYFVYSVFNGNGNAPPLALAQNIGLMQGEVISITLSGSDANSDALTFEVADQPLHGILSGTPPQLSYAPDPAYVGADSFGFTVYDGSATSRVALVSINISGDAPNNATTITVDGNLADWSGSASFGADPLDANALNDTIDWVQAWVAHDNDSFYFAYTNEGDITLGWGYGIYIDTDENRSTGFTGFQNEYPVGADFLLEGSDLQKYTGTGTNWSWTSIATLNSAVSGNQAELSVARSTLENPDTLQLFYLGENAAANGSSVDYYPDNVTVSAALTRFFNYNVSGEMINAPPVANGQVLSTARNIAVDIVLSATDPENAALSYELTLQPQNGELTGVAPNLRYTPTSNFSGTDSFTFRAGDGNSNSSPATVTINVSTPVPTDGYSNAVTSITLDGDLSDWNGTTPFSPDAAELAATTAEKIDWRQGRMAHSDTTLYIAYQNDGPISALTWGHAIYLDTDTSPTTGFRGFSSEYATGADYLLEGSDLYKYSGSGTNWVWAYVATVATQGVGAIVEVEIPRTAIDNSASLDVFWRGDNGSLGGSVIDLYPNSATDASSATTARRFRYNLQP